MTVVPTRPCCAHVGEAQARWLWAVLWPADAGVTAAAAASLDVLAVTDQRCWLPDDGREMQFGRYCEEFLCVFRRKVMVPKAPAAGVEADQPGRPVLR